MCTLMNGNIVSHVQFRFPLQANELIQCSTCIVKCQCKMCSIAGRFSIPFNFLYFNLMLKLQTDVVSTALQQNKNNLLFIRSLKKQQMF